MGTNEIQIFALLQNHDMENNIKYMKSMQGKLKLNKRITMGSGAGSSVMPRRMVMNKSEISESEGFKTGVHYVAANDGRIPNEGKCDLKVDTVECHKQDLTFQIAEVKEALCAISYFIDKGYKVVFDKNMVTSQDMSHMMNKETGAITRFRRQRNVRVLDALFSNGNDGQGFHRRG